ENCNGESVQVKRAEEHITSARPNGRGAWINLCGPINDVDSMYKLLMSPRYGFKPENIIVLKDGEATRERILQEFQKLFIDGAKASDVGFFFYAGHGSRVRNSKSNKYDKNDETIVPVNATRNPKSVVEFKEVRDKELSRMFNRALDKGVVLTAVFDSCHSGSIERGIRNPSEKARYVPGTETIDVADPPDTGKTPGERGALVLSAVQAEETAKE